MKVSLVIPMYNEMSIIDDAIKTFSTYMRDNFEDWELIFVSDGSTDGCGEKVKEASLSDSRIILEEYEINQGKGCAVRTGIARASGDIIVFTDCDNAYGEETIKRAVDELAKSDADILIGSRNLTKDGYQDYTFIRKLASKTYIKVIQITAGFKLSDSQCGFKAFRHDAAKKIFYNCQVNRFAFDLEVILIANKVGYKIIELPVKIVNHRESKVNVIRDTFKMLNDLRKMKKRIKNQEILDPPSK